MVWKQAALTVGAGLGLVLCVACLAGCPPQQALTEPGEGEVHPTEVDVANEEPATEEEVSEVAWQLTSTAFEHGERIPTKYTGDGEDISPPLAWGEPPEGTAELALICDDPDAPVGTWNHWVLYGLSPEVSSLPEAIPTTETVEEPALKQGLNSWPKVGYGGPSPPPGKPHRYQFTLYALSETLDLEPRAEKQQLLDAMEGKVLAKTMLEGTYGR